MAGEGVHLSHHGMNFRGFAPPPPPFGFVSSGRTLHTRRSRILSSDCCAGFLASGALLETSGFRRAASFGALLAGFALCRAASTLFLVGGVDFPLGELEVRSSLREGDPAIPLRCNCCLPSLRLVRFLLALCAGGS